MRGSERQRERERRREKKREGTREKARGNERERLREREEEREGKEGAREKQRGSERERERERERGEERGATRSTGATSSTRKRGRRKERGKQRQDQQSCGFWIGHNFSNCVFFLSLVLSFSRSLTPHALSSLCVHKENLIGLLHQSFRRCLPPRSPRMVCRNFSSRTKTQRRSEPLVTRFLSHAVL